MGLETSYKLNEADKLCNKMIENCKVSEELINESMSGELLDLYREFNDEIKESLKKQKQQLDILEQSEMTQLF